MGLSGLLPGKALFGFRMRGIYGNDEAWVQVPCVTQLAVSDLGQISCPL